MYEKIRNLKILQSQGLNVHEYVVPNSLLELITSVGKWDTCSIRTDAKYATNDLPFYTIKPDDKVQKLLDIWAEAEANEHKLIVANELRYDPIQICNLTVWFDRSGNFQSEVSAVKVPLRKMHSYPNSLLYCKGSIWEKPKEWEKLNNVGIIDKSLLQDVLFKLYNYKLFNQWLECTVYPEPVGVRGENIVFW